METSAMTTISWTITSLTGELNQGESVTINGTGTPQEFAELMSRDLTNLLEQARGDITPDETRAGISPALDFTIELLEA